MHIAAFILVLNAAVAGLAEDPKDRPQPRVPGTPADEIETLIEKIDPNAVVTSRHRDPDPKKGPDEQSQHVYYNAVDIKGAQFGTAQAVAAADPTVTVIVEVVHPDGSETNYKYNSERTKLPMYYGRDKKKLATGTNTHFQKSPKKGGKPAKKAAKVRAHEHDGPRHDRIDRGDGDTDRINLDRAGRTC